MPRTTEAKLTLELTFKTSAMGHNAMHDASFVAKEIMRLFEEMEDEGTICKHVDIDGDIEIEEV